MPYFKGARRGKKASGMLCFLILSTLLLPLLSWSETPFDFRFTRLTLTDGIPSLSVQTIFQQQNGYLWIGTDSGVSRYDGKLFTNYQYSPGSKRHITSNMVTGITEDALGNVWVSSEGGLNRIKPDGTVTHYQHDPKDPTSLQSPWLLNVFSDNYGQIWICGSNGLSRYDAEHDRFIYYPISPKEAEADQTLNDLGVFSIAESSDGVLFAATSAGILSLAPGETHLTRLRTANRELQPALNRHIEQIYPAYDGSLLFFERETGLLCYNPKTKQLKLINSYRIDAPVNAILQYPNGDFWLGHPKGITILNEQGEFKTHLKHDPFDPLSLPANDIYKLYLSQDSLMWVATTNGLAYYSRLQEPTRLLKQKADGSGLSDNLITSVKSDDDGMIWLGTESGIDMLHADSPITPTVQKLTDTIVWHVSTQDSQFDWAAASNGLYRFNKQTDKTDYYSNALENPHGLPISDIYTVLPDEQGGVWFTGYFDAGLSYFHPDTGATTQYLANGDDPYSETGNFSTNTIWGPDGRIWMATTHSIFSVDIHTGRYRHILVEDEPSFIRVSDILFDHTGSLWATTHGRGLVRIDFPEGVDGKYQVQHVSDAVGSPHNSFRAIVQDSNKPNILWLTGTNQLYRFDIMTEQLDYFPSLFTLNDAEFIDEGMSHHNDALYIASTAGLFIVDTNKLLSNRYVPNLQITRVSSSGETLPLPGEYEVLGLPYEQNDLQIDFAALDYTAPRLNHYRYSLNGSAWRYTDVGQTTLYLSQLQPGAYSLVVEGTNSDGVWSQHQAKLKFYVNWAYWHWLLLTFAAMLVLVLTLFWHSRRKKAAYLQELAYSCSLTGLANRRQFLKTLDERISGNRESIALILLDLDNFKQINDTLGHNIGDLYIQKVASNLKHLIRKRDLLARLGGDEFAIIIDGQNDRAELTALMERMLRSVSNTELPQMDSQYNSASMGLALFPEDGNTISELVKNADTAMYAAKREGKNGYQFFQDPSSQRLRQELDLSRQIDNAIHKRQIKPWFQPRFDYKTNKIVGFEALARWEHPLNGIIGPDRFIPLAETNGSIIRLGRSIIKQSCECFLEWKQAGLRTGILSVNLSPIELRDPELPVFIQMLLAETQLPASSLELEITESLLMEDIRLARTRLEKLKALGVRIALDDFGSGFSSLGYLGELPLDTLKIDRSFIQKITDFPDKQDVFIGIISIAQKLGLDVVAEGISNAEQLAFLHQTNCEHAQGYLLGLPMTEQECFELLSQKRS